MSFKDGPRSVSARRMLTLSGVAVSLALPAVGAPVTGPTDTGSQSVLEKAGGVQASSGPGFLINVAASGGGEGEGGQAMVGDVDFLRDLGYLTGRLRVGLALAKEGDRTAARAHMGQPIAGKYEMVAERAKELGLDELRGDFAALSAATEADAPVAELERLYDKVMAGVDVAAAASPSDAHDRLLALAELARIAAGDYSAAVEDAAISDLGEYQDAWGFVETIRVTAGHLAASDDARVAEAAQRIVGLASSMAPAFGDLQGNGIAELDPSLLYAAAARMELAALGAK